jgi:hypothetical protein
VQPWRPAAAPTLVRTRSAHATLNRPSRAAGHGRWAVLHPLRPGGRLPQRLLDDGLPPPGRAPAARRGAAGARAAAQPGAFWGGRQTGARACQAEHSGAPTHHTRTHAHASERRTRACARAGTRSLCAVLTSMRVFRA